MIMGFLKIDESKCKKDGICVRECPMNIIQFRKDNGYPGLIAKGESICIWCGHCVAVCPYTALDHEKVPLKDCPTMRKDLGINKEQAGQFLRSRRSIRLYKDKPVEREKIRRLIEIARYAPTGGNSQLVEWVVIQDKETIKRIAFLTVDGIRRMLQDDPEIAEVAPYLPGIVRAWDSGIDSVLRNAPALIVASASGKAVNGMVDLTIALSYLELFAPAIGLGTCWAGLLQRALLSSTSLKEIIGIPAGHHYHYPMLAGYPAAKYHRLPARKPPKITFKE